jgi:uncharacterized hydrophobic protein (TIGR00341 family)
MRLIQLAVPEDTVPAIETTLDDEGIDYYSTAETDRRKYDTIVHFSVETPDVEPVLDRLYEAGLSSDDHGVIVDVETDLFEEIERDHESESRVGRHARIADAELRTEADNQIMDPYSFVQMTVLSALVATVGLILDSAAVIIGAMVIAPLLGPALSSTVGTVLDEQELFWRGVRYQAAGIVVAVASAALFAWALRTTWIAPPGLVVADTAQIAERLSPDILSLILALAAGAAGVLSLATRTKSAIVGVMIAAALIPPAATAGLGVAWGYPVVAIDAGLLVLVNLLAINLAGLGVFWYLGYRPPTWLGIEHSRKTVLKRSGILLLLLLVVSIPLVVTTNSKIQGAQLEDRIETDVREVVDRPQYADVVVESVRVEKDPSDVTHPPKRVVVVLGIPSDTHYPELSPEVAGAIIGRTSQDVGVRVEFVHVDEPIRNE